MTSYALARIAVWKLLFKKPILLKDPLLHFATEVHTKFAYFLKIAEQYCELSVFYYPRPFNAVICNVQWVILFLSGVYNSETRELAKNYSLSRRISTRLSGVIFDRGNMM